MTSAAQEWQLDFERARDELEESLRGTGLAAWQVGQSHAVLVFYPKAVMMFGTASLRHLVEDDEDLHITRGCLFWPSLPPCSLFQQPSRATRTRTSRQETGLVGFMYVCLTKS